MRTEPNTNNGRADSKFTEFMELEHLLSHQVNLNKFRGSEQTQDKFFGKSEIMLKTNNN
jgi:hypothetical protein